MQLAYPRVVQPKFGAFGLESAIEYWPSGTDAWQDAKKPLRKVVANHAIFDERPTRRTREAQGLFLGGSGLTYPADPKTSRAPQAPANKPNPSKDG